MNQTPIHRLSVVQRHAFPLAPYIWLAPTTICATWLIDLPRYSNQYKWNLLLVAAISYVAFFLILAGLNLISTQIHASNKIGVRLLATIGTLAGLFKGLVALASNFWLIDIHQPAGQAIGKIISGALIGTFAIPSIAYLNSQFQELKERQTQLTKSLIASHVNQLEKSQVRNDLLAQLKNDINADLSSKLTPVFTRLLSTNISRNDIESAVVEFSNINKEQIVQIQQKATLAAHSKFPELRIRRLIQTALDTPIFTIPYILTWALLSSALYIYDMSPNGEFAVRFATVAIALTVGLTAGNFFIRRATKLKLIIWLITLLVTGVLAFFPNLILFNDNIFSLLPMMLIFTIWISLVALFFSVLKTFQTQRQRVEHDLVADLDESSLRERSAEIVYQDLIRDLIDFIHGRVQSRVMASTMLLSSDDKDLNEENMQTHIEELRSLATSPLTSFHTRGSNDLVEEVGQLSEIWSGLMEVTVENKCNIRHPNVSQIGFTKIIEESLLNAFRHGRAAHVEIVISNSDTHLYIDVCDDGLGPQNGPIGTGSSIFDAYCNSWTLQPGSEGIGSVLKLVMPTESN